MPTAAGPNSNEQGLVFAIDMGDVTGYKGQPATNIWESGHPNPHGSALRIINTDKWLGKRIDSGVVYHNMVNRRATADSPDKTFFNNGGLNMGSMQFSVLRSDTKYIQISFDYYGVTAYKRFCCPSSGLNGYLGVEYSDGSRKTSGWDTTYSPGNGDDWNNLDENMGKWQRISLIATLDQNLTPQSIWALYIYYDALMQGEGYFANMIFTEHSFYPTGPVKFVNGSRSRFEAIKDLTGTVETLDVNTVTLGPTSKLILDGTNDYIRTQKPASDFGINHEFSFEYVIYFDSATMTQTGDGWGFPGYNPYWGYSNRFYISSNGGVRPGLRYQNDSGSWIDSNGSFEGVIPFDQTVHVVIVKGPGYIKSYLNGELRGEGSYPDSGYDNTLNGPQLGIVGWDYLAAEISMTKIYNRTLDQDQVIQNYNILKKRFNI